MVRIDDRQRGIDDVLAQPREPRLVNVRMRIRLCFPIAVLIAVSLLGLRKGRPERGGTEPTPERADAALRARSVGGSTSTRQSKRFVVSSRKILRDLPLRPLARHDETMQRGNVARYDSSRASSRRWRRSPLNCSRRNP